jgi:hypothetical protein
MKRLAAVALVVAGIALPGWGQRGGARGGGSGRSAIASRSAFAMGSQFNYAGPRLASSSRAYPGGLSGLRPGSGYPIRQPVYSGPVRRRVAYVPLPYGLAVPYGVGGWLGPDYLDNSAPPADAGLAYNGAVQPGYPENDSEGYPAQPQQFPPDSYRPPYAPQPEPANEVTVTLIFKDGRPSQQIHNYILTPKTLYVEDEHHRIIPVEQLDLAATEQANLDTGVDFKLPEVRR